MESEIQQIVSALVAYVLANPLACDTQDGIERWWLSDCGQSSLAVAAALNWMVMKGYLQTATAADGRVRFRRIATDDSLQSAFDELPRAQQPPGVR
jgi:hypothetical protein